MISSLVRRTPPGSFRTSQDIAVIEAARDLHKTCKDCDCKHDVDAQVDGKAVNWGKKPPIGTTNPVVE